MEEYKMILRLLFISIIFSVGNQAHASERYLLNFDLTQNKNIIQRGKSLVSQKSETWNKGLLRSYLKLSCLQQENGEIEKLVNTVNHFSGLLLNHQLIDNTIVLTVTYSAVKPRLTEIRALPKQECKNLSPIVNTITETYRIHAKNGNNESYSFGENMTFRITVNFLGKSL